MDKSLFFYNLPAKLIAQSPASPRDHSRLMSVDRATGAIHHLLFYDIADLLHPGDLLVINDSRVIPARLLGKKAGGETAVETLLLRDLGGDRWETIVRPGKKLRVGAEMIFESKLTGTVEQVLENGNRIIRFDYDRAKGFYALLDEVGNMPLPHYITKPLENRADYQTVYARHPGSAAAPTAGFHFTEPLFRKLGEMGVEVARVTLHVGLGTFRPVKEQNIENHLMHREYYSISEEAAEKVNNAKREGRRVIAVGTTSCRTLEACYQKHGEIVAGEDSTDIFIYPGCAFGAIDGLITNFHLPESTLIMLVAAFLGYENTMNAYRIAVEEGYRFYSFGDAMAIL